MIISASYRSDIPAFHGAWFLNVLKSGEVWVPNPYSRAALRVDLSDRAVEGYVFWTRNARPFRPALDLIARLAKPAIIQMTITGYPRGLDPSVPAPADAIGQMRELSSRLGKAALVWRYDPIVLTPDTEIGWHKSNFERLAQALCGTSDEVVVSFAQFYNKSRRNMAKAGLAWREPGAEEKAALALELFAIAAEAGLGMTLCAQKELSGETGIPGARCVDAQRLSRVALREIGADRPKRPNRPGCLCARHRDIGSYDRCAHGCRYCYAVSDHARAAAAIKAAAASPGLD